jgi:hypothetical protein
MSLTRSNGASQPFRCPLRETPKGYRFHDKLVWRKIPLGSPAGTLRVLAAPLFILHSCEVYTMVLTRSNGASQPFRCPLRETPKGYRFHDKLVWRKIPLGSPAGTLRVLAAPLFILYSCEVYTMVLTRSNGASQPFQCPLREKPKGFRDLLNPPFIHKDYSSLPLIFA